MKPAVFLDRDGVLNKAVVRNGKPYPPATLDDVEFFPGLPESIRSLRAAGYYIIVVTNQPDVAKGVQSKEMVEAIHGKIRKKFNIDDIKVCYHTDEDDCICRKPKPGMLLEAAGEFSIDLSKSYMIGDRWRDIEAGKAAGCKTILVRGDMCYDEPQAKNPDAIANSLVEACELILVKKNDDGGRMPNIEKLKIKIFADGADLNSIKELYNNPYIKGFTTNPTLMKKANVKDYKNFAMDAIKIVQDRPISFEVFSDDFIEMEKQAMEIASWGRNVYVKIPITNTKREDAGPLVRRLSMSGVKINVTALMTVKQVGHILKYLSEDTSSCISIFAGRISDTGRDPVPIMAEAVKLMKAMQKSKLIWASPRELLNIFQADAIGCHIITVTNDLLAKLPLIGKNLDEYSLETVQMFYRDAVQAGFSIKY